jgi:hypothetical protein
MNAPSTAERLAFFGMSEPTPTRTPAPRPSTPLGPEASHRLHGAISIKNTSELRITTQPALDARRPARMVIRRWYLGDDGRWWPVPSTSDCWVLHGEDAQAFARAVAEAAAALASEAKT